MAAATSATTSIAAEGMETYGPVVAADVGAAFGDELRIFMAGIADLHELTVEEFRRIYLDYGSIRELADYAKSVLGVGGVCAAGRCEVGDLLFPLTKHGIVKSAGAGGVCALLKTEPALVAASRRAMRAAGLGDHGSKLWSSWDSVCFLVPSEATTSRDACPDWIHRDVRLEGGAGGAETGVQMMVNLSPHTQDGPAGDACFVYVPGSHVAPESSVTPERLAELGVLPAAIKKATSQDFVTALSLAPGCSSPMASPLWPVDASGAKAPLRRATIQGYGAIAWDSRLLHCGSLFASSTSSVPPRSPRMTKYVHYFCPSTKATRLASTKTGQFLTQMVTPVADCSTSSSATSSPAVYPIAITTPHRGSRKNGTGKFDTFRTGKRQRMIEELNEKMTDPRIRNFFSLPYMLARALQLLYPTITVPAPKLADLCADLLRTGTSPALQTLYPDAAHRCMTLRKLHIGGLDP